MSSAESSSPVPDTSATAGATPSPNGQMRSIDPKLQLDFPAGAPPDISKPCFPTPSLVLKLLANSFFAFPLIVRANQKDVYYQNTLQEQMTDVFQRFIGTSTRQMVRPSQNCQFLLLN